MNLAFDECECGHVALVHDVDDGPCSECECQEFKKKLVTLGPYDHVPN